TSSGSDIGCLARWKRCQSSSISKGSSSSRSSMSKRWRSIRAPYHTPCVTLYYMELTTAMLADGAQVAQGKLYILGGQWDRVIVSQFPAQHPSMAVVLVIKVNYNEAPKTCVLTIELMLDGEPMGIKTMAQMSIGHAAGLQRGAPQFAPTA